MSLRCFAYGWFLVSILLLYTTKKTKIGFKGFRGPSFASNIPNPYGALSTYGSIGL